MVLKNISFLMKNLGIPAISEVWSLFLVHFFMLVVLFIVVYTLLKLWCYPNTYMCAHAHVIIF
jgi:hypothetical protein